MMTGRTPLTRRELSLFAGALALAVAVLLVVGGVLWTRPFWMDELATYWVTDHASPIAVIGHIAKGGEWSPPFFHLVVWLARTVAGDLTPTLLRAISLSFVVSALVFVYATLRRRFDAFTSVAGLLLVATHTLLLEHAFEGRMYSAWLACAAGYAWALGLDPTAARSRRRDVAQAVAAVLLCTVHWFGVLSLGLSAAAALFVLRVPWRERLRFIAPSAAGFVALLACAPLIGAQRRSAQGILWVADITFAQVMERLRLFFPATVVLLLAVLLVARFLRQPHTAPAPAPHALLLDRGTAALASLALMPLVLVVVSIVIQPSMLPRYMIVALLGWAVPVALGVELLGTKARAMIVALLAITLVMHVSAAIAQRRNFDVQVRTTQSALEQGRATGLPLVFQALHPMYPAAVPGIGAATSARFIAVPDSTIRSLYVDDRLEYLRRHFRLEREIGREHWRLFGFPPSVTQAELETTSRFVLVAADTTLPQGYRNAQAWGRMVFPGHRVTRLSSMLVLFERQAPVPPRATGRSGP